MGPARKGRGAGVVICAAVLLLLLPTVLLSVPASADWVISATLGGEPDGTAIVDVAVAPGGALIVSGASATLDLEGTPGAFRTPGASLFVAGIAPGGGPFEFIAPYGGSYYDFAGQVALDFEGNIFVAGFATEQPPPTTSGAYSAAGPGYVLKLNQNGTQLLYGTRIPGVQITDLAVDGAGSAYIVGESIGWAGEDASLQVPLTAGAYDANRREGSRAFLAKLAPDGGSLVYSTYLDGNASWAPQGGEVLNSARAVVVDAQGAAYVTGNTGVGFLTTEGAYRRVSDGSDAFVMKVNASGATVDFATAFGGSGGETGADIAIDSTGAVFITGRSTSMSSRALAEQGLLTKEGAFPATPGAFEAAEWGAGVYVAKLSPDGEQLVYAAAIGGGDSSAMALEVGPDGSAFVAGVARGDVTLSPEAHRTTYESFEGFVLQLDATGSSLVDATFVGGSGMDTISGLALLPSGAVAVVGYTASPDFGAQAPVTYSFGGAASGGFVLLLEMEETSFVAIAASWDGTPVEYDGMQVEGPWVTPCNEGSVHTIRAIPPPRGPLPPDMRVTFIGWPGDGVTATEITCHGGRAYRAAWLTEVRLELMVSHPGISLLVDGQAYTQTGEGWVPAGRRIIEAPAVATVEGRTYAFDGWSDDAPRVRIEEGGSGLSVTARYREVTGPDFAIFTRDGQALSFEGHEARVELQSVALNGMSGPITLQLISGPEPVTIACQPALQVNGTCTLVVRGGRHLEAGVYPLVVAAESGGVRHDFTLRLHVAWDMGGPQPFVGEPASGIGIAFAIVAAAMTAATVAAAWWSMRGRTPK